MDRAASYENFPLFTYKIGYREVCGRFQGAFFSEGREEGVTSEDASTEEFIMGDMNFS